MAAIPTVVVTKGDERVRVNECDLHEWKARGFEPVKAEKKADKAEKSDKAD